MLKGEKREYGADATLAGCERLWQMAIAPGTEDAPVAQFARKYIRLHHPDIGMERTSKPVDPGAEIPAAFLTFERVEPLLVETRKPLREFALDIARWEFARWAPPAPALVRMSESSYGDVRQFVLKALLADDAPEHRRYRIDPATLSPAAVFSFCESPDEETRILGMELIRRSPRLQVPDELFRLTESPDRKVRAFVIRALWALYRDRGISRDWQPRPPQQSTIGKAAKKAAEAAEKKAIEEKLPARPEKLPADHLELNEFLRRILFEIPPGMSAAKKEEAEPEGIKVRLRPLPARKAKLNLVELMRDVALEDRTFARGLLPLLREFMASRGKSEQAACLVAVTRIQHTYPELNGARPALA
jgi:hypothetical protein